MAQFDYIIVGAGSAGCVLANRLTQNPKNRVLLLEAGGRDSHPLIHIPAGYAKTLRDETVNWCYDTEPDAGTNHRVHYWPRGKVLGGSSSINGMLYVRGQKQDYDLWRQLGNHGWSWDDVLPYFKKSECFPDGDRAIHGQDGPLHVTQLDNIHPISDAAIQAGVQAGLTRHDDPNDGIQEGISYFQTNTKNGKRCSAAAAFLRPALSRPNLHVETHALVNTVLVKNKRAIGVSYTQNSQTVEAHAGRDILLSGGAINSPQLLQLSGIGPVDLLKSHGIDVVHGLPGVGENLQDHIMAGVIYRTKPHVRTVNHLSRGLPLMKEVAKWLFTRKGLLTVAPAQVQAYVKSRPDLETADLQFLFLPASISADRWSANGSLALEREGGFTLGPLLMRPESRGWIHIRSDDAQDAPRILPNYLDKTADQLALIEGIKWARAIANQAAFAPYRDHEVLPGAHVESDEDILTYIRDNCATCYHPVGTCKMGADAMSVVDHELKVYGVEHLRVVDASIMPRLVSGNTNAPTMMIAEKAADMILNAA